MSEFRHSEGTVLCDVDGVPTAVVLTHDQHLHDTPDLRRRACVEAFYMAREVFDVPYLEDEAREAGLEVLATKARAEVWRYATEEDVEEGHAEEAGWCGPHLHGEALWVLTWSESELMDATEVAEALMRDEDE